MMSVMVDRSEWVNRRVVARTAQGDTYGSGRVVSYADRPTFQIERDDGSRFSWLAVMSELAIDEAQVNALADLIDEDPEWGEDGSTRTIALRLIASGRVVVTS